ncbi:MAG: 4-hydroxybenzoyl-CoA thioesterase [Nocardia sp.]|uniref:acyl-CoA thioesterase n=1 Tax=Nocardia sp. TaxID=1821 RepID=UPI002626B4F3|nr:thioesterase family protein [Nocardia sp.]MCU1644918.1 4-hydroxybenzoyl-CoA thioesterase [Nocardia sp.]
MTEADARPEGVFRRSKDIQFHHCDPAGIVFYPNYLVLMNEVLQEWFTIGLDVDYPALFMVRRIGIPAVRLECNFTAASRFGDAIHFELCLEDIGRSSFRLHFRITGPDRRSERLSICVVLVCISLDTPGSIAIPADIRAAMRRFDPTADRSRGVTAVPKTFGTITSLDHEA